MKYKTIIKLVCEAENKEEAFDMAGEYLRGREDLNMHMSCRAVDMRTDKLVKGIIMSVICTASFLLLILCGGSDSNDCVVDRSVRFSSTCTVMPELKTADQEDFKDTWEQKKEEAILEYIKN